jgi:hypothetical protein
MSEKINENIFDKWGPFIVKCASLKIVGDASHTSAVELLIKWMPQDLAPIQKLYRVLHQGDRVTDSTVPSSWPNPIWSDLLR